MSSILLVDDDHVSCDCFAAIFRHLGYQVTSAASGFAALELLEQSLPDLVILDVMMPKMNGLEVLKCIRTNERTASLPVVMFSALDDDDWRERAVGAGADDYWIKGGFDFGELEQTLRLRLAVKNDCGAFIAVQ